MRDDRLRVPVEADYVSALGLAVYAFASLEWNAVWCCQRLNPTSLTTIAERVAGRIADRLKAEAEAADTQQVEELRDAAAEFKRLVDRRNDIMHGKPGTLPGGAQLLFRHGQPISADDLRQAADEFTACSIRLNDLLHGALSVQAPSRG